MDGFLNALKAQASALDQGTGQLRFGIVASVDPATATARVMLQPEGVLSGWLPVLSPWVGAGWGLACPPSPGEQVLIVPQEGDAEHGVIVGRSWSGPQAPPPAPSGELWLVHRTGTFLKLRNDGTVQGSAASWSIVGDVTITGSLVASGDVSDGAGALSRLRGHYDAHTHVDSRGGQTSQPTPQD